MGDCYWPSTRPALTRGKRAEPTSDLGPGAGWHAKRLPHGLAERSDHLPGVKPLTQFSVGGASLAESESGRISTDPRQPPRGQLGCSSPAAMRWRPGLVRCSLSSRENFASRFISCHADGD